MKTALSAAFLTLCVATSAPAFAHEGHDHGGACKADVQKFCKDVKPGEGRIINCLKSHEADLSTECKAHGEKMQAHMKKEMEELNTACKTELATYCKDVKSGEGRKAKCLVEHKSDKYSAKCSEEVGEMQEHWKEHKEKMDSQKTDEKK